MRTRTDLLLLVAVCGFLFFYGLGAFGLLGADEPRYAQVAREMHDRNDWITPTLLGKPWLEKPPLYYWQAMVAFSEFGVDDRSARMPAAFDALVMVAAFYFFLRKVRPGSETEGALIMASCAATIGFARAAATDMPLAATFAVAMLSWYAWRETNRRLYLAVFYAFLALGTLAKGPVAPFLAALILAIFCAIRREWRAVFRTLWIPGIILFLAIALPWYVAVQLRNPEFFRVFILEHNLARFGQDLYHHRQPFWFYVPVLFLSLMPWTLWALLALWRWARVLVSEGKSAFASDEDAWPLFLIIWLLVPVVFFSASQSKLPGYILPAIPAGALLVSDFIASRNEDQRRISPLLAIGHALLCSALVFIGLAAPNYVVRHRLTWDRGTLVAAAVASILWLAISAGLISKGGVKLLRVLTLVPVLIGVATVLKLASPLIDEALSARPIVASIQSFSHEPVPVAVYGVNRAQEYGLEFFLNRAVERYDSGKVPPEGHVLIVQSTDLSALHGAIGERRVSHLSSVPLQKLELYWVAPTSIAQP